MAHELIFGWRRSTPDAAAVVDGERTLSYRELDEQSGWLAGHLLAHGVEPGDVVAIALPRSATTIVSVLAVLRVGAAYILLDTRAPVAAQASSASAASVRVVLSDTSALAQLTGFTVLSPEVGAWHQPIPAPVSVLPDSLAYLVTTSGSTGVPKLVGVSHRALSHHVQAMAASYDLSTSDRVLQFANPAFDVFVEEVFPTLGVGATVIIAPDPTPPPGELAAFMTERGVTVANLPTPYWGQWVAELEYGYCSVPERLRLMVVGSDVGYTKTLRQWRAHTGVPLINAYGAAETTVTCAVWRYPGDGEPDGEALPIGTGVSGARLSVRNENGQPVPDGDVGELYVAGALLADGYRGRPAATAESFVPDLSTGEQGMRMFRTRDRVRRDQNGNLVFLGRLDRQVKVRGHLTDPAVTTFELLRCSEVSQAYTVVHSDPYGGHRLVSYAVSQVGDSKADAVRLRKALADVLPEHQVPAQVQLVERLPLTANGKVDEAALPKPGDGHRRSSESRRADHLTRLITRLWSDVLNVEIGPDDNAFDRGAHSLMLIEVRRRLSHELDRDVPGVAMFAHPTPASLADYLSAGDARQEPGQTAPSQRRPRNLLLRRAERLDGAG